MHRSMMATSLHIESVKCDWIVDNGQMSIVVQVHVEHAISRSRLSRISHSTNPIRNPRCLTLAVAVSNRLVTGRMYWICRSTVEKSWPLSSIRPKAIPIAASARAARTPPWTRPMGLCNRSSTSKATTANPNSLSSWVAWATWNPISCEIGALEKRSKGSCVIIFDTSEGFSGQILEIEDRFSLRG